MELTQEQKKTFENLKKPTMSLIGAFYEMPSDVKEFFADMMAVYEANPNEETAKMLSDKVMGRESVEAKKAWMKAQVASVSLGIRTAAKKKYLDEMQAVPKGVPVSGMVMTGLNIISRADKDALMDAQAAARIIETLEKPHSIDLKKELVTTDKEGKLVEPRAFLDKPFATKIQRLEHLSALLAGVYSLKGQAFSAQAKPAQDELLKEAVSTLYQVVDRLEKTSPQVALQIHTLARAYMPQAQSQHAKLELVSQALKNGLPSAMKEIPLTEAERKIAEGLIEKRMTQVMGTSEKSKEKGHPTYTYLGAPMDFHVTINNLKNQGR